MKNRFFRHLESIQSTKEYNFDFEYNPHITSIGLSQHVDSVLFVNDMNMYWQFVTPKMHYDYLFSTIRKMKRPFVKWAKKTDSEDIQLIMEEYQISRQKALEYLTILTEDQIKEIRQSREKGGLTS